MRLRNVLPIVLLAVALPNLVHADEEVTPVTSRAASLTLTLPSGWTIHPGVTFGPGAGYVYDFTHHTSKWTSNLSVGGQLVIDYKSIIAVGGGITGTVSDDGKLAAAGDVLVVGPGLPISTGVPVRPAVLVQYTQANATETLGVFVAAHIDF